MAEPGITIDLNADVGEGYDDAPLFPHLSSVNVACGAHAGDDTSMRTTVERASAAGLAIGAHPSFPDREGFGRRVTTRDPEVIRDLVRTQTAHLAEIAASLGVDLSHVKPHGALYTLAARDREIAEAVALGVRDVDSSYALVGLAGSGSIDAARSLDLATIGEAFVDRAYRDDGNLAPRGEPGAVLNDPQAVAPRALALARGLPIESDTGIAIAVSAETLCLHGDTAGAVTLARAVARVLREADVRIARPIVRQLR